MIETRYQTIQYDIRDLISEYLSDRVGDDELEEFITRAKADEESVTLLNEIINELNYRKEWNRNFDNSIWDIWFEETEDESA